MKKNIEDFIAGGGILGTGCHISSDVVFGTEPYLITIGNNVRLTHGVKFVTHDGGIWVLRQMGLLEDADLFGKISIGDNTHIGWDSIIMPGVRIGKNCIIGVGAVVTKDIPDNSVAVGVPAKVIETIEQYYEKVKDKCDFTKHMTWDEKKAYIIKKYFSDK